MSGVVKLFGVLKSQAVKENNYSKKRYFLPQRFIFLTSILRVEDWVLQPDCHIIQQICDFKQDSEVSDILMYSLAVTVWINFLYLWKVGTKLNLALAFIIYKLHSQIHGISSVRHNLPFQVSCVTPAGMANQSWHMFILQR